jgi:hypothetical protein
VGDALVNARADLVQLDDRGRGGARWRTHDGDATFAGEPVDSSSVAGILVLLNGSPVAWHVSKVKYMCRSSTDSELHGCDDAFHYLEITDRLRASLAQLSPLLAARLTRPVCVFTDNSGLRDIAMSPDDAVRRTLRHVRTRVHRIRDAVRAGAMSSRWVPACDQLAESSPRSTASLRS